MRHVQYCREVIPVSVNSGTLYNLYLHLYIYTLHGNLSKLYTINCYEYKTFNIIVYTLHTITLYQSHAHIQLNLLNLLQIGTYNHFIFSNLISKTNSYKHIHLDCIQVYYANFMPIITINEAEQIN